jgi:hypothetical protein
MTKYIGIAILLLVIGLIAFNLIKMKRKRNNLYIGQQVKIYIKGDLLVTGTVVSYPTKKTVRVSTRFGHEEVDRSEIYF